MKVNANPGIGNPMTEEVRNDFMANDKNLMQFLLVVTLMFNLMQNSTQHINATAYLMMKESSTGIVERAEQ